MVTDLRFLILWITGHTSTHTLCSLLYRDKWVLRGQKTDGQWEGFIENVLLNDKVNKEYYQFRGFMDKCDQEEAKNGWPMRGFPVQ